MKHWIVALYVIAALFFISGIMTTAQAVSAIHQIDATLSIGFGALLLMGIAVIRAIQQQRAQMSAEPASAGGSRR